MPAAVPFIIAALKTAAVGATVGAGVSAIRGGNIGRGAGMGALAGAGGGLGGVLGGVTGAGIGTAAGTYAGGAATSQKVTPTQAALAGVTGAVGHKLLGGKKLLGQAPATKAGAFTPSPSTMGTPSAVMGASVPGFDPSSVLKASTFPASTIGTAPGVSGAVGPTGGTAVPGYSSYNVRDVLGSAAANVAKTAVYRNPFTPQLPTSPTTSTGAGGVGTGEPSLLKGLGEKAGDFIKSPSNILGLASMGGSMLPKTPQFEMPSYVSDLRTKLMEGESLSPLGQQAKSSLSEILGAEPTELYPTANDEYYNAALRRTRESYEEAEKRLDAAYNLAGVYGSGEHLAEKGKLQEELARTESALYAQTEQRRFELARTTQYQAIQDSLQVDRATMDDIVGLTGLDVQTAAMIYGAQVADITAIRESLGTLGMELMLRGTGLKSDGGININLGQ